MMGRAVPARLFHSVLLFSFGGLIARLCADFFFSGRTDGDGFWR